ncbi:transcriptional regulator [Oceanobacillus piezotolerans]|uniref:Transcriptional regulator n=2 Tax=Oceanobacillus piezotolerans TaxID=2448030 RepID=A0A498DUH6_9BACI|nr:transcriptional regulator [Oceanobacillus piezotolerans]
MNEMFQPGEVVYVIVRNPHVQGVAHVQQAAVVVNPDKPYELALFSHETYYPLTDDFAVFKSEAEAERAYQEAFGTANIEDVDYFG